MNMKIDMIRAMTETIQNPYDED